MYEILKKVINAIVPKQVLISNKDKLRSMVAFRYIGNKYQCNICGFKLSKFITLHNGDLLCPKCGSLPRTRRLITILDNKINYQHHKVLHFSPPESLAKRLSEKLGHRYVTTDFAGEFKADKQLDITNTKEKADTYDIIICYHVLEHVIDDLKAMSELYRILTQKGYCIIQTPFKDGDIFEDASITTEEQRLMYFGQEDHVRIYSVSGLKHRLEKVGFTIDTLDFKNQAGSLNGFKQNEIVLVASKK